MVEQSTTYKEWTSPTLFYCTKGQERNGKM